MRGEKGKPGTSYPVQLKNLPQGLALRCLLVLVIALTQTSGVDRGVWSQEGSGHPSGPIL